MLLDSCGGKQSALSDGWSCVGMTIGGLWMVWKGAVRVDRTPAGVSFMCPFAVAVESASAVRPGHEENWLLLMALIHVDGGGLNAHWCRNWMSLALEDV